MKHFRPLHQEKNGYRNLQFHWHYNKCIGIDKYIIQKTNWIQCWWLFSSASKLRSALLWGLGCVNICDAIGWFQRPNWKAVQDRRGGDIQLFNPFPPPFVCFTLMNDITCEKSDCRCCTNKICGKKTWIMQLRGKKRYRLYLILIILSILPLT